MFGTVTRHGRACRLLASAVILATAAPAWAAEPQGAAPAAAVCAKPALPDRTLQPVEFNGVMRQAQDYVQCMQKAVEAQRAKAAAMLDSARAEAEKSNQMVAEVNGFVKDAQRFQSEQTSN